MLIKKINLSYQFKKESVVVYRNAGMPQGIAFHSFGMYNKKRFKEFAEELATSKKKEYDTIADVYTLASQYNIRACRGHATTVVKNIAF